MRIPQLVTGEYYHVYGRGVDKRCTFLDETDYATCVNYLLDANFVNGWQRPLVSISAYAFMPNHYHFLMRQEADDGISKLFHKAHTGYSKYFNTRHGRDGRLWSRPFQAKRVTDDAYLQVLIPYIHKNALALRAPNLTENAIEFLNNYRWSSFPAYCSGSYDPLLNARLNDFFSLDDHQEPKLPDIPRSLAFREA